MEQHNPELDAHGYPLIEARATIPKYQMERLMASKKITINGVRFKVVIDTTNEAGPSRMEHISIPPALHPQPQNVAGVRFKEETVNTNLAGPSRMEHIRIPVALHPQPQYVAGVRFKEETVNTNLAGPSRMEHIRIPVALHPQPQYVAGVGCNVATNIPFQQFQCQQNYRLENQNQNQPPFCHLPGPSTGHSSHIQPNLRIQATSVHITDQRHAPMTNQHVFHPYKRENKKKPKQKEYLTIDLTSEDEDDQ